MLLLWMLWRFGAVVLQLCPRDLQRHVDAHLAPLVIQEHWAVSITTLNTTTGRFQPIAGHNPTQYSTPASNAKLFTTAGVWVTQSPTFTYTTNITTVQSSLNNKTSTPDLCIRATGDPSVTYTMLQEAAQAVGTTIHHVNNLLVDTTHYRGVVVPPTWQVGDLTEDYGAPPSAMVVNGNTITFTVGPSCVDAPPTITFQQSHEVDAFPIDNRAITVDVVPRKPLWVGYQLGNPKLVMTGEVQMATPVTKYTVAVAVEPDLHAGKVLLEMLKEAGVAVAGTVVQQECSLGDVVVHSIRSPPLTTIMNHTLKESDNLYAESFLKEMAARNGGKGDTYDIARVALQDTLTKLGVPKDTYNLADGSGVSRQDMVTPQGASKLLESIWSLPASHRDMYISMLPVAGVDGTLKDRFVGTPGAGIIHAKTGTLTGVSSLSGYMLHNAFPPTIFSVIVNLSKRTSQALRADIDSLVLLLPLLRPC